MKFIIVVFYSILLLPVLSLGKAEQTTTLYAGQMIPENIQWNRYVTDNFEILSIDDAQGHYLYDNIEKIKTWVAWRWGIRDEPFDFKCKIICVPSTELYESLFSKKIAIWHKDAVWIVADLPKWDRDMPVYLTEVILNNFAVKHGKVMPMWCRRGMSVLNGRLADIKFSLASVKVLDTKSLFQMTEEVYNKLDPVAKSAFDSRAAAFCLWLKQDSDRFLDFLGGSFASPEKALSSLGIVNFAACDAKIQSHIAKKMSGPDTLLSW